MNLRKDMVLYAEWGKVGAPADMETSYAFQSKFDALQEQIEIDMEERNWISTHKKEAVDMLKALIATIEEKKEG